MRAVPFLAAVLVPAVLAGCIEKWQKPGASQADFDRTKAICHSKASSQFPSIPRQIQITPGYTKPVTMQCSGYGYTATCFQTGGQYVPPVMMTVDDNEPPRDQAVRGCLMENGWTPAKD